MDGGDCSFTPGQPDSCGAGCIYTHHMRMTTPDANVNETKVPSATGLLGYRTMAGIQTWLTDGAWGEPNELSIGEAVSSCATYCKSERYRYMGLQWTGECYCDNEYDRRGEGLALNEGGASDCGDTAEHPMPVCASEEWTTEATCGYAIAVFRADPGPIGNAIASGQPLTDFYVGCYRDGPPDQPSRAQESCRCRH